MKYTRKQCACGGTRFYANQRCYHDVIVDSNGIFDEDIGISMAENPYEPFVCTKCSTEYETLCGLESVEVDVEANTDNDTFNLLDRPRIIIGEEAQRPEGESVDGECVYPIYGSRYFSHIIIGRIAAYQDSSDEWCALADIKFVLRKQEKIRLFESEYVIESICYHDDIWNTELVLSYVLRGCGSEGKHGKIPCGTFPLPDALKREIYDVFSMEARKQHGGIFKSCCFDEDAEFSEYNDWPTRRNIIENIQEDAAEFCRKSKDITGEIPEDFLMSMVSTLTQSGQCWNPEYSEVEMEIAFGDAVKKLHPRDSVIHCLKCDSAFSAEAQLQWRECCVNQQLGSEEIRSVTFGSVGALIRVCPNCDTDRFLVDYKKKGDIK